MDTIVLSVRKVEGESDIRRLGKEVVDIVINGRNIREIVYEVESANLIREGKEPTTGGYELLEPDFVFLPYRNFLGEPDRTLYPYMVDDGRVPILRCVCGDIDCGPVYVRITLEGGRVVWSEIGNPAKEPDYCEKPWDYSSLHFVFDREQYMSELSKYCPEGSSTE